MSNSPKLNEEIIERALNGLRDLAPDAKFNNKGLTDLELVAGESMTARRRLIENDNDRSGIIAARDDADERALKLIEQIVAGIIGHDDFGKDSALYEAFGYVRRSKRKSGLTRKKKKEVPPMP